MLYYQKGDADRSIQSLEKLYVAFPLFTDGSMELLAMYLSTEKYAPAKKLIAEYKATPNYQKDRLQTVLDLYPDAAKSLGL